MGGGGSRVGSTETREASSAPELRPLFSATGRTVEQLQPAIAGQFGQFFAPNPQAIPSFTPGQEAIANLRLRRAFGSVITPQEALAGGMALGFGNLTRPEQAVFNQLGQLETVPFGQLPMTQAAIQAARTPVLNELALAGLGHSDAVATNLGGAITPILAEEMRFRQGAIPYLLNIGAQQRYGDVTGANVLAGQGATLAQRQSGLLAEAAGTEEAARMIQEASSQARLADLLRRQQLGTTFTTGVLGGFPNVGTGATTTTASRTSGGGAFK